jgi:dimethylaniline monooxygenase (N-oxide forming)
MRVAVIVAGASGLAAAKSLLEVGIAPVVYEETDTIGGLWVERDHGVAYRSLKTNTSRQITAFSDFPFPRDLPDYPQRAAVEQYLQDYAGAFGLRRLVRFGRRIESVVPAGHGWRLTGADHASRFDAEFDSVVVCAGIFRTPLVPPVPGLESFTGCVLHSKAYRTPAPFREKVVVVVGLGSSACDIAADLAAVASRVILSVRRRVTVIPRTIDGVPLDNRLSRLVTHLPARIADLRHRRLVRRVYRDWGLSSPADLWTGSGVEFDPNGRITHDALGPLLRTGEVVARPAIQRVEGDEVLFADGRRLRADAIVFATGYQLDVPFLSSELQPWSDPAHGLYRLVFPPPHPTLPFVGVCRVSGPVFPVIEMQARWVAQVLRGDVVLPNQQEMRAEIAARWERTRARDDAPYQVALLSYLDEIGEIIGARPRLWRHPTLLRRLLMGPPVAAHYRLEGPNRATGAATAIRDASCR